MRILLLSFTAMALMFLGSCKKCNEKDCQNGASCSLLNNEAVCSCTDFYEGDRCETETRSKYYGVYSVSGEQKVGSITLPITAEYILESNGSSASKFKLRRERDNDPDFVIYCTMTDNSSFTVTSVSEPNTTMEASGSFSFGNRWSLSGTFKSGSSSSTIEMNGFKQ